MSPALPFFKTPRWPALLNQLETEHHVVVVEENVPGAADTPLRYLRRVADAREWGYPLDGTDLNGMVEGPWVVMSIVAALNIDRPATDFAGK